MTPSLAALGGTGFGRYSPILLITSRDLLTKCAGNPFEYDQANIRAEAYPAYEGACLVGVQYPSGQILVVKSNVPQTNDGRMMPIARYQFNELVSRVNIASSNKGKVVGDDEDESY